MRPDLEAERRAGRERSAFDPAPDLLERAGLDMWSPLIGVRHDGGRWFAEIAIRAANSGRLDAVEADVASDLLHTGALVDLLLIDLAQPDRWHLRLGHAIVAGIIGPQIGDRLPPARIHRRPIDWARSQFAGIVLLSGERLHVVRILEQLHQGGVVVADRAHAAELMQAWTWFHGPAWPPPRMFQRRAGVVAVRNAA